MTEEENILEINTKKTALKVRFNKRQVKYLVDLFEEKFYNERHIQPELLELIAGLTAVITGNINATLPDDNDVLDDVKQTSNNLDKLEEYFMKE